VGGGPAACDAMHSSSASRRAAALVRGALRGACPYTRSVHDSSPPGLRLHESLGAVRVVGDVCFRRRRAQCVHSLLFGTAPFSNTGRHSTRTYNEGNLGFSRFGDKVCKRAGCGLKEEVVCPPDLRPVVCRPRATRRRSSASSSPASRLRQSRLWRSTSRRVRGRCAQGERVPPGQPRVLGPPLLTRALPDTGASVHQPPRR
jgi:hypothetical protein